MNPIFILGPLSFESSTNSSTANCVEQAAYQVAERRRTKADRYHVEMLFFVHRQRHRAARWYRDNSRLAKCRSCSSRIDRAPCPQHFDYITIAARVKDSLHKRRIPI
jgi:hypothetical protein